MDLSQTNNEDYVTVVSVGTSKPAEEKDYVTVLKIGNDVADRKEVTEEVLVYRLPGEKLGFGLKFEGGTKSAEFVKRLFIQSCAVNSPASRVQSSWGLLAEGDEVLEIDSVPVNTMTRIDCVRCLKDSNVVIKLLIKHRVDEAAIKPEDLPLVVSAEKKRTPPPPPPVPPRKVNRKSKETTIPPKGFGDVAAEAPVPVPLARQSCGENNNATKNRQSPYNSFRKLPQSPEVGKKARKLSDDGTCPPDAEVYTDLFSQESAYSLSESDDTGSSISTVVDRLGSYPTTTTSSFAGSLPSTPTPVQKHIDLSSDDVDFPGENYLFSKLVTSRCEEDAEEKAGPKNAESNPPLQPPANFQDAPLSYGNEDVKIEQVPPSPPPRSRNVVKKEEELPRLVDFVPKSSPISNSIEIVKHFLENEKCYVVMDDNENHIENGSWCDEEYYTLDWNPSSKLATIGEDEEEAAQDERVTGNIENPVVIIENADSCGVDESGQKCANISYLYDNKETDLEQNMEFPPTYSRQPPDGHEFPDYQEDNKEQPIVKQISDKPPPVKPREVWKSKCEPPKNNVRDKIAMFSNKPPTLEKKYVSSDNITLSDNPEKCKTISRSELSLEVKDDCVIKPAQSDLDINHHKEEGEQPVFKGLSGRSMSLSDVSNSKPDKWSMMVEQRRRCLSRLKGLVIPENIPETELNVQPFVDLPEIKSEINVPIFTDTKTVPKPSSTEEKKRPASYSFNKPSPTYPSAQKWLQKFKSSPPNEVTTPPPIMDFDKTSTPNEYAKLTVNVNMNHNQCDPPKSLESITSPTRSDYSFEYIYSPDVKTKTSNGFQEKSKLGNHLLEDESDNDSALSSSQSSYISKNSPPASPTNTLTGHTILSKAETSYDSLNRRLLKAQSVEAINRKNILASARCRSGRDLKVGSPLIQRKFEDEHNQSDEGLNASLKEDTKSEEPTEMEELKVRKEEPVVAKEEPKVENPGLPNRVVKEVPIMPIKIEKEVPKKVTLNNDLPKPRCFAKAASVNDLRKNFEKESAAPAPRNSISSCTNIKPKEPKPAKRMSMPQLPQPAVEISAKIDETTKDLNEIKSLVLQKYGKIPEGDLKIVFLKPDVSGGSIGITLAGGSDYETKEITIHKIRSGSPAHRDGKLQKGDRILLINGTTMKDLSHSQSLKILKENVPEVTIVACTTKDIPLPQSPRRPLSLDAGTTIKIAETKTAETSKSSKIIEVTIYKDVAGLGFSIQGGQDSPQGNVPLVIKKLFVGGAAEKSGKLQVDDELLEINGVNVTSLSRIDAWNLMKKLPEGDIAIRVRR